jgi:hypothetical protein
MKMRREAVSNSEPDATREDIRDLAEALSLYRSAMHHVADREVARPFVAERRPASAIRFRFVLAPALTVVLAVAALVPVYSHFHRHHDAITAANNAQTNPADARAAVDDTVLMNQIDSELSEEVPDALRPLADVSDQRTSSSSATEKKNVTQE